jgi:poly(3-hydroxybutyrate) depolymerase
LKSGNFSEKINNVDRKWILDVPSGYDNSKPTRLIFVWHPLMGTADQVAQGGYNGLKALSNNSTIFVAPNGVQGSNSEASGNGWWNKDGVDMLFLEAMLKKIKEGLCIDLDRVFTTGFSFGGMMSYTIPWVFEGFRATAPCSGKVGVIDYTSKYDYPIPTMAFHGNADTFVSTALGKQFFEKFRTRNKCGTETKKVDPSPCVEYQGCVAQTIWCEFSGQHEQWSQEPAAIWKFFAQF